jgi:hypothetical protein
MLVVAKLYMKQSYRFSYLFPDMRMVEDAKNLARLLQMHNAEKLKFIVVTTDFLPLKNVE